MISNIHFIPQFPLNNCTLKISTKVTAETKDHRNISMRDTIIFHLGNPKGRKPNNVFRRNQSNSSTIPILKRNPST